ncbi:MAG TPA: hypothetical protein V6D21_05295 [Candidatus Obscuribacterales bacterium]
MHMAVQANIAAIVALDVTNLEDGIIFWALTEKCWLGLEKASTATVNSKSCWTATGGGRWFLSRDSEVVANTTPTGGAATGTRWLYQENNAVNTYDSVISYFYNGTAWVETDTRMRLHTSTPDTLTKTPNSDREIWKDTSTGMVYHAFSGGWVAGGAVS